MPFTVKDLQVVAYEYQMDSGSERKVFSMGGGCSFRIFFAAGEGGRPEARVKVELDPTADALVGLLVRLGEYAVEEGAAQVSVCTWKGAAEEGLVGVRRFSTGNREVVTTPGFDGAFLCVCV